MTVIALNKCNVQLQRDMFNECRLTKKKKSKSWAKKTLELPLLMQGSPMPMFYESNQN